MAIKPPTLLLFDLGGVLLENSAFDALTRLSSDDFDVAEFQERWLTSPAVRRFELGRSAPPEFADAFLDEWRVALSRDEFLREFIAWPRGFYAGARELLASLRRDFRIACLSNSNELHWAKFDGFEGVFDIALSSHRLGVIKPDDDAFLRALEICAVAPTDVLFFDDSLSNVRSAERLGLRAFHVDGVVQLRHVLAAHGLLQPSSRHEL